eukprot:scaffold4760_cov113-Isochrysis_galbana.AAC.3
MKIRAVFSSTRKRHLARGGGDAAWGAQHCSQLSVLWLLVRAERCAHGAPRSPALGMSVARHRAFSLHTAGLLLSVTRT